MSVHPTGLLKLWDCAAHLRGQLSFPRSSLSLLKRLCALLLVLLLLSVGPVFRAAICCCLAAVGLAQIALVEG